MEIDELKPLLPTLIGKTDGPVGDRAGLKADVARPKADMAVVKPAVARLETAQAVTSARLDGQRFMLAALNPTRIAAVPPAAE